MILNIRHITRYRYAQAHGHLIQRLHLTPATHANQTVLEWAIEAPGIESALVYTDAHGSLTHVITPPGDASEVVIVAHGRVETHDAAGVVGEPAGFVPLGAYLNETAPTQSSPSIRALARQAQTDDALAQMHALMNLVGERVAFEVGTTHAHTTAAEALEEGRGVCQDHAHVMISAARLLGVPARYVSGYLALEETGASEASHAWAEAHLPELGWVGFDAANRMCPDARYVRVAVGMDARDAAPVRGVRRGPPGTSEALDVEVLVARESAQ